jgi:hypothetical protein
MTPLFIGGGGDPRKDHLLRKEHLPIWYMPGTLMKGPPIERRFEHA